LFKNLLVVYLALKRPKHIYSDIYDQYMFVIQPVYPSSALQHIFFKRSYLGKTFQVAHFLIKNNMFTDFC